MHLKQYEKYMGIIDAGHGIWLDFLAPWAKRQSGNTRLEAARAPYSPCLHNVQTPPLGYKLGNKISTPEVTVSTQCGSG